MKSGCWLFYFLTSCTVLVVAEDVVLQPEFAEADLGADVIIPCTFSSEKAKGPTITVIWRMYFSFTGPVIFLCSVETNCSKSLGRYSLHGHPTQRNVSLKIKNVSFKDEAQYFCRVEQGDFRHENRTGTKLMIQVSPAIESIYIQTLPSGKQYVTCDVKGIPPPNVTWIMPENINDSLVTVKTTFFKTLSFIPVIPLKTSYTCQIDGKNGQQNMSIHLSALSGGSVEQECQILLNLFIITVVVLACITFILIVVAGLMKKTGSLKPVNLENHQAMKNESIYANT